MQSARPLLHWGDAQKLGGQPQQLGGTQPSPNVSAALVMGALGVCEPLEPSTDLGALNNASSTDGLVMTNELQYLLDMEMDWN